MTSAPLAASRRRFTAGLAALAVAGLVRSGAAADQFKLFDALLHRGKPQLRRLGLEPMPMVWDFWPQGAAHDAVDEAAIGAAIRRAAAATGAFFLDIEDWPVLDVSAAARERNVVKLVQVAQIARRLAPQARFGFYGLPPAITYWPLVEKRPAQFADWREADRLMEPLAALCDFVLPSLYTFYADRGGWLTYAQATIREARRYGKPVYPFLWYEYHDSNPALRGHPVESGAWREELQLCRSQADGIVLWGGYQQGWSESAPWWQTVCREFKLPQPGRTA
jgi:hypothetical protein